MGPDVGFLGYPDLQAVNRQEIPMVVRKEIRTLSSSEKRAFVDGLLTLKKSGRYDEYVHWHHAVMVPTVFAWEPVDPDYRNGAHRGPAFLPWHREFLLQLEADLRRIDANLFVPYWDWTLDACSPEASPIWAEDFMGGNGVEEDGWRVGTGPFAYRNGNWTLHHDGPALTRRFGTFPQVATMPNLDDLRLAMAEPLYDTPNYNSSPFTLGFRNRIEGWITQRGDSRVRTPGSQLHNRVHLWVGGAWQEAGNDKVGSMVLMTSPNDPVFFLHHCFIDKIWADWQGVQKREKPDLAPHYAPREQGPRGHNLNDTLQPWTRRIAEVLDVETLGYTYDPASRTVPSLAHPEMMRQAVASSTQGPRIRSAFAAD